MPGATDGSMPVTSKPQAPISGLGRFDGAGAAAVVGGAAGAASVGGVGAGRVAGVDVADGLDPQPAIVARITANNRVCTWGSGSGGVPLTYQATPALPRARRPVAPGRSGAAVDDGPGGRQPGWRDAASPPCARARSRSG